MDEHSAQIALDKIHEASKRLCTCFPFLTSRIQKLTFVNAMNDLKRLTEKLFSSNGESFLEVVGAMDEVERVVAALEKHAPQSVESIVEGEGSSSSSVNEWRSSVSGFLVRSADGDDAVIEPALACHDADATNELEVHLLRTLDAVVADVRRWERLFSVQHALWREKRRLGDSMGKPADQFT